MIEVDRHRSEIIKPKYLVIKEINYPTHRAQGKILDFTETGCTILENQGLKNRKGF